MSDKSIRKGDGLDEVIKTINTGKSIRHKNNITRLHDWTPEGQKRRLIIKKEERLHFKCLMCGRGFRKGKPTDAEMCPSCLKSFRKLRGR